MNIDYSVPSALYLHCLRHAGAQGTAFAGRCPWFWGPLQHVPPKKSSSLWCFPHPMCLKEGDAVGLFVLPQGRREGPQSTVCGLCTAWLPLPRLLLPVRSSGCRASWAWAVSRPRAALCLWMGRKGGKSHKSSAWREQGDCGRILVGISRETTVT